MHIMLPISFHTDLTVMIYYYPHSTSHSENFAILYDKYVELYVFLYTEDRKLKWPQNDLWTQKKKMHLNFL